MFTRSKTFGRFLHRACPHFGGRAGKYIVKSKPKCRWNGAISSSRLWSVAYEDCEALEECCNQSLGREHTMMKWHSERDINTEACDCKFMILQLRAWGQCQSIEVSALLKCQFPTCCGIFFFRVLMNYLHFPILPFFNWFLFWTAPSEASLTN